MSKGSETIAKNISLEHGLDYSFLRGKGIEYIQELAGKVWTDYNVHDPGITSLEILSYAISELSYRASMPIENILAKENESDEETNFFTAAEILPSSPVTMLDYRKLVIDIVGVKNVWLLKAEIPDKPVCFNAKGSELYHCTFPYEYPAEEKVDVKGIYDVVLEFEDENLDSSQTKVLLQAVRDKLMSSRNLCEDFRNITSKQYENIAFSGSFEFKDDVIIEKVLAEVFYKLEKYISPDINFYTLKEMLEKGYRVDEIFEGPLLKYGFILNEDLESTENQYKSDVKLYSSDIINEIVDIDGIVAVKNFCLTNYIDDVLQSASEWIINLSNNHISRFNKDKCNIVATSGNKIFKINNEKVVDELNNLRSLEKISNKGVKNDNLIDIEIPYGTFSDFEQYHSIQEEYPHNYHLGSEGISNEEPEERKAQVKQLKAYLLFFEQLLANYFSQLSNVRKLFSLKTIEDKTYFTQSLLENVPFAHDVILDKNLYVNSLSAITENRQKYEIRRNKFLDHLLARFAEDFSSYAHTLFLLNENTAGEELIKDKILFFKELPELGAARGKAFDYTLETWSTDNVAGLKKRISKLLGMSNYNTRKIGSPYNIYNYTSGSEDSSAFSGIGSELINGAINQESFHVVEHLLLRPRHINDEFLQICTDSDVCTCTEALEVETNVRIEIFLDKVSEYRFRFRNEFEEIILKSQEGFDSIEECQQDIIAILEFGKDHSNYKLKKTKRNRFYFNIKDDDNDILGTSQFYKTADLREETIQYLIDGLVEIEEKRDEINEHEANSELSVYDKDLYSFRVTVVLPAWLDRFQNYYYRELTEKTILSETPAHIAPNIYWVDEITMYKFETRYKQWLKCINMPNNSAIRSQALNELIYEIDQLKFNTVPPNNYITGDYNNT